MFCIETILFLAIFPFKNQNIVSQANNLETFNMDLRSYLRDYDTDNLISNIRYTVQNFISSSVLLNNKYILAIALCLLVGSTGSEFLQYWLTNGTRNFDLYDMIVNGLGCVLGITLFYLLEQWATL